MNLIKYMLIGFGLYMLSHAMLIIYQGVPPTLGTTLMVLNIAVILAIFNIPITMTLFLFKWLYNFCTKRGVVSLHCEDNRTPRAGRNKVAILCYESDRDYR